MPKSFHCSHSESRISHFRYLFKKALMEDELADAERRLKASEIVAVEAKEDEDEVVEAKPVAEIQVTQPKKTAEPIGMEI